MDENFKFKILIVDDKDENIFSLESMLQQYDREFLKANSGNEALKIAYKEDLSLILLDVQMPEMDGFETAEFLKSNNKTKKIPIVFVTAINKDKKFIVRGIKEGAIDYLYKPLDVDITRAKVDILLKFYHQQQQLESLNSQLIKLNEEKNYFLGMAAHDLRNPLVIIQGFADLILDDGNSYPEETVEHLNIIKSSSEFCLELVNNLLDVSKIESGKLDLKLQKINLISLIKKTIKFILPIATKKNIIINLKTEFEDLECTIDESQFEQVLNNLISNGIKYSEMNTVITCSVSKQDDFAVIEVKDQGKGIPENEMNKLFKPFQKTSVKSTAGEKSTGLGLVITKKIVEAHKGTITVESKQGEGTSFTVKIPLSL